MNFVEKGLKIRTLREEKARRRELEKQKLMTLSEKELLVEILLELKELNKQSEKI